MTVKEAAERAKLSPSTIYRAERVGAEDTITLLRLVKAYGCRMEEILLADARAGDREAQAVA